MVQVTLATGPDSDPITGKKQTALRQESQVLSSIVITSNALPTKADGDVSLTLGVKYLDQYGQLMPTPADAVWSIVTQRGTAAEGATETREAEFRTEADAHNGVLWLPTDVDNMQVKVTAGGKEATATLARDNSYSVDPQTAKEILVTRLKGSGAIYIPVSGQVRYGFGATVLDDHGSVVTPIAEGAITWRTMPTINGTGMAASTEDVSTGIFTVSNNAVPKNGVKITALYGELSGDTEVNLVRTASELKEIPRTA